MAKPSHIELQLGRHTERIPILHEDRSVIAIDKPPGWMLVPFNWQKTRLNLQAAIQSSIGAGAFWARSRGIRFLRYVHRLDAETTGVLLLARSPGALDSIGALFEAREVDKRYLAVVHGRPPADNWTCSESLDRDPSEIGRMRVVRRGGKPAETHFRLLSTLGDVSLVQARPTTGRTHQIRLHLAHVGLPIIGDPLYGADCETSMALRAIGLSYIDPFVIRTVRIRAPAKGFLHFYGFESVSEEAAISG